jgi:hypothetical protein
MVRLFAQAGVDPHGRQAEGRVGGHHARQAAGHHARVDRQELAGMGLAIAHFHALERDAVGRGLQFQVVADVHRRRQEADLLGELLADALDALEQFAALPLSTRDQAVAHFQAQRIDRHDVVPAGLLASAGAAAAAAACGVAAASALAFWRAC